MSNTGSKEVKLVNKLSSVHLLMVLLLLLGSIMIGIAPVFAAAMSNANSSADTISGLAEFW